MLHTYVSHGELTPHTSPPSANLFASGSRDGVILLWSTNTLSAIKMFQCVDQPLPRELTPPTAPPTTAAAAVAAAMAGPTSVVRDIAVVGEVRPRPFPCRVWVMREKRWGREAEEEEGWERCSRCPGCGTHLLRCCIALCFRVSKPRVSVSYLQRYLFAAVGNGFKVFDVIAYEGLFGRRMTDDMGWVNGWMEGWKHDGWMLGMTKYCRNVSRLQNKLYHGH